LGFTKYPRKGILTGTNDLEVPVMVAIKLAKHSVIQAGFAGSGVALLHTGQIAQSVIGIKRAHGKAGVGGRDEALSNQYKA